MGIEELVKKAKEHALAADRELSQTSYPPNNTYASARALTAIAMLLLAITEEE